MEGRSREIASSNNPVPVLGQFLEQSGAKEAATNFAKNFVKSRFNKEKDNNKTEDNKNVSVIEKSQNFIKNRFNKKESNNNEAQDDTNEDTGVVEKTQNLLNRFNQTGLKADLSGVGFEKTFGNKDQGLSATVYGQQDFGRPAEYGARLGFNYKF